MPPNDHLITYLTAAQVRARFGGISDMALWRWLHKEELGFPQPLRIQGRRFWKAADLTAWERSRTPEQAHPPERAARPQQQAGT
jgi:predicted DNA-binding transcriptional regulator AlpA